MVNTTQQYVNWFRHSSPYINAHKGKTFVLLFGGEAVEHSNFANIIHDIALLSSLGVHLVLVHGLRPQIEANLKRAGIQSSFHKHLRITDSKILPHVTAANGTVRAQIEALLSMGVANSPMHGADIRVASGNFIMARPIGVDDGVDLQHTGEVRRIDWPGISYHLAQGNLVLLSPIGYSLTGEIFNLNKEDVAVHTAQALQADKLIIFGANPVTDDEGSLIREMSLSQASALLEQQDNSDIDAAVSACTGGIKRTHLLSYQQDGALLQELFTRDGCGTLITENSYESIRSAEIDDVGGILALIEPLEADGTLVHRSRERLETEINHFTVIERDGMIIGCAALYPFSTCESTSESNAEQAAELACVVIHPDYRSNERGDTLLASISEQAKQRGLKTLFVLTTKTAHWFQERGFELAGPDQLPAEKQSLYNFQRNSKVFTKSL